MRTIIEDHAAAAAAAGLADSLGLWPFRVGEENLGKSCVYISVMCVRTRRSSMCVPVRREIFWKTVCSRFCY